MVESVAYRVVKRFRNVEVREYPSMVLAEVVGLPELKAFSLLFRYISGNNRTRRLMPMTSPVVSGSERVEMTAPVMSREGMMAFVLPPEYSLRSAPEPVDERIRLVEVSPRRVAALRFSGHARRRQVENMTEELIATLDEMGGDTKGRPFLMRYDSPGTPGFLRRNEVAVEVASPSS